MGHPYQVQIRLSGALADLYYLGYLSIDMYQLMAFADALDNKRARRDTLAGRFAKSAAQINRFSPAILRGPQASIVRARQGSVELTINVVNLLVAVVLPLVVVYMGKSKEIKVEVEVNDPVVNRLLKNYERGEYGRGHAALDKLFTELRQANKSVRIGGADVYLVHDVLKTYSQRMVKTIKKK